MKTPQLGIGAVILNENEEILLLLRKKNPEANTWSIPGGKVETYESLEEATKREIKEEVGLDISITRLLCTAETIRLEKEEHWVSVIYEATVVSGTPMNREPDKIGEVGWFSLDCLPPHIACFTLPAIQTLKERNAK